MSSSFNHKVSVINITADAFSNHGTISCDVGISPVEVNCCRFVNTGIIASPPTIFVKQETKLKKHRIAVWSKSEKRVEMTVYDHRGHNSSVDWRGIRNEHHPRNSLMNDGVSAYESDANFNTKGDWIIYKLSETVKPSRINIRSWTGTNSIKSVALWIGNDDGTWYKMCDDITGIKQMDKRERKPQTFPLSSIASDEKLLTKGADLLMFEMLENYGWKYNTFASIQLFGYPLVDVIQSE